MQSKAVLLLAIALASPVFAQEGAWADRQGKPLAETESMRSRDGFAGTLLATPDADWSEKWNTPSANVPEFNVAKSVAKDQQVVVLTLFSNPALDAGGKAHIACTVDVTGPDGKALIHQDVSDCYRGTLKDGAYKTYLAQNVLVMKGSADAPAGTMTVRVVLTDQLRHTVLPLQTSFNLE